MNDPTPDLGVVEPMLALTAAQLGRKLAPKPIARAKGTKPAKKARRKAQKQARRAGRR